jgi:hypothetical protein
MLRRVINVAVPSVQRLDDTDPPIDPCQCGWTPELGRHFPVARP